MFEQAVNLHARRGRSLYASGDYDRAMSTFLAGLEYEPESLVLCVGLADCYSAKQEWDNAIGYYTMCIDKSPDDPYFRRWRANALMRSGQLERASVDAEAAVRLSPSDSMTHAVLAYIQYSLGEPEKAVESYGNAIRLDPDNANHHSLRGEVYTSLGRHDLAIADHDRAFELAKLKIG
jgi:tetratricopeptide (TPR) repeat protein